MFEEWQPGTAISDLEECPHFGNGILEIHRRYFDGQSVPFRVNGRVFQGFPTGQDFSLVKYVTTNGLERDDPDYEYNENLAVRNIVLTFHPITPYAPTENQWEAIGEIDHIFGDPLPHDEVPYQYFQLGTLGPVYEWVSFEVGDDYLSCSGEYFSTGAYSYEYDTGTAEIFLFPRPEITYWRHIPVVNEKHSITPAAVSLLLLWLGMMGSAGISRRRRS